MPKLGSLLCIQVLSKQAATAAGLVVIPGMQLATTVDQAVEIGGLALQWHDPTAVILSISTGQLE